MGQHHTLHPRLQAVSAGMPLLADLHRGDVLLYEPSTTGYVRVVAQARPHSVPSVYARSGDLVGQEISLTELPAVSHVVAGNRMAQRPRHLSAHRSHIVQRAFPVRDDNGVLVAVLSIEKSLVEFERHATRRPAFRQALHDLRDMVLRGNTGHFSTLSPFRAHDGILLVNDRGTITYVSGLASYHYRRLGYSEELIGRQVSYLDTADQRLVARAFAERYPFEEERQEEERIWVRKVIPLAVARFRLRGRLSFLTPHGFGGRQWQTVLITIHDATAARRKEQEQAIRQAMVQEIHHRVKNNLQTVASLLRIQARRASHEETRQALHDAMNRILSVAVVHEFLSQHEEVINVLDVARRIARQVQEGVLHPSQDVRIHIDGVAAFLHAHQTTMVALVLNELLLNALEHGFREMAAGDIFIFFADEGDAVCLSVRDTGAGLPEGFSLSEASNLGLRIVETIVQEDLRGQFELNRTEQGTEAKVLFRKTLVQENS